MRECAAAVKRERVQVRKRLSSYVKALVSFLRGLGAGNLTMPNHCEALMARYRTCQKSVGNREIQEISASFRKGRQ